MTTRTAVCRWIGIVAGVAWLITNVVPVNGMWFAGARLWMVAAAWGSGGVLGIFYGNFNWLLLFVAGSATANVLAFFGFTESSRRDRRIKLGLAVALALPFGIYGFFDSLWEPAFLFWTWWGTILVGAVAAFGEGPDGSPTDGSGRFFPPLGRS